MKSNFIFLTIFLIGLISLASAFESPEYSIGMEIDAGGVEVDITNPIIVNITACTSGATSCDGTNSLLCVSDVWVSQGQVNGVCGYSTPSSSSGSRSSGGGSNTVGSILSNLLSFNEPGEPSANNKNSNEPQELGSSIRDEETQTSRSFITGAATGITEFAKSPKKVAVSLVVLLGCAVGIITFRKRNITIPSKTEPIENKEPKEEESKKEAEDKDAKDNSKEDKDSKDDSKKKETETNLN